MSRPEPAIADSVTHGGTRFPCFDGLRAIAALAVFVCHSSGWAWYVNKTWAPVIVQSSLARLGYFGVAVFFVISGFLLYRPFVMAHLEDRPAPRLGTFWFRRCARVFPAYWVALTVAWLVFGLIVMPKPVDVVTYFGLLQNYRGGYVFAGLGVAWTLVIEVSFYFVLPGIAWVLRHLSARNASTVAKVRAQVIGLIVMAVLSASLRTWSEWWAAPHAATIGGWLPLSQLWTWVFSYLDWFAIGMLMAVAIAWRETGGRLPRPVVALGERPWLAWLMSAGCLGVLARINYPWVPKFVIVPPGLEFSRVMLSVLAAGFLVFPAVFGDQGAGVIRSFLRARVMVAVGLISYGIYLWHDPLWQVSFRWVREGSIPSGLGSQFVVVLGLTLACATASYFIVERPIRIWVHRWTSSRSSRAPAPT